MKMIVPPKHKLREFGLTEEDYEALWLACDGRCPICTLAFAPSLTRRPVIDHDHKSGEVRGLLCSSCNRWLGYNHDNADKFTRAAAYLTHTPAATAGVLAWHELHRGKYE